MTLDQRSHSPSQTVLKPITFKSNGSNNVSTVIDISTVNLQDTVLSHSFQENGGIIDLEGILVSDSRGNIIKKILVPRIEATFEMDGNTAILHPIAKRANNILRVLNAVQEKKQDISALQKSVLNYYTELSKTIFGKNGIYNRYLLGPRIKNSFRAVIVPGKYENSPFGNSYEWVGIPSLICERLNIQDGDNVVIGRDPTIWYGSLEILKAYKVLHNAIVVHPLLLPQLGGDHDGDQVWGYVPKQDVPEEQIALMLKKYSKWSKNLLDLKKESQPDWGQGFEDSFRRDEEERAKITGLSVSPLDIIDRDSPALNRVLDYCGKGVRARGHTEYEELQESYKGKEIMDWFDAANAINMAMISMKAYMGPIGLASLRLQVLGHNVHSIQEACNILSERCSQSILDSKHLTIEQIKNYKPAEILDILNLRRKDIKNSKQMFEALQALTNCDERVYPFVEFLIDTGTGLDELCRREFILFEGTTWTGETAEGGYCPDILIDESLCPEEGVFSLTFSKAYNEGKQKSTERTVLQTSTSSEENSSVLSQGDEDLAEAFVRGDTAIST